VDVQYRDYGAEITSVDRLSPAYRAGLETRDVIVTVNGYQVGRVMGRLYPLDRELHLRADRRGRVVLLIQNRRNGRLQPIPVRLQAGRRPDPRPSRTVSGTITAQRVASLPHGAVLTVRLLDVTGRRLPPSVISRKTYRKLGPLPIPLDVEYDEERIEPRRSYALEAEVTVNGFAAWRTPERYPVFESSRQGRVHMVLEPVRR
jgi:uncharacterized lipoprotein YbaY